MKSMNMKSITGRVPVIRADGYVASARPESHARPLRLWRLVDPVAARQWLADHPAPRPQVAPGQQRRLPLA
jgi:hypothetical protein